MTQRMTLPVSTRSATVARVMALMVILAFTATSTGCKWFKKEQPVLQPVETMYETAHQSMKTANWDRAQTQFRSLIAQYPYGPYTEQALMESAYAQYKAGKLDDAVSSVDKFLRNQFARHELDTALYYMRRDAYVSAATRARYLLETYPQSEYQYDAVAVLGEAYTKLGNKTLADDARRVLQLNDPQHPWLTGDWPKYPWQIRRLNPFAGEKSPASGLSERK